MPVTLSERDAREIVTRLYKLFTRKTNDHARQISVTYTSENVSLNDTRACV